MPRVEIYILAEILSTRTISSVSIMSAFYFCQDLTFVTYLTNHALRRMYSINLLCSPYSSISLANLLIVCLKKIE